MLNKIISICVPSWFEPNQGGRYHPTDETYYIASRCLKRLKETLKDRNDVEIILIDNGSTLKTKDIPSDWMPLEEYWGSADKLISNSINKGFGPAVNQGIEVAEGEYILILNNDIFVWNNFLENLLEVFKRPNVSPPVGVIMPNLIKAEHYRDRPDLLDRRDKLETFKVMEMKEEEIRYPNKEILEAGSEFGSAFMMKREVVDKIKNLNKEELGKEMFFDENFIYGMGEDRKLWNQIRLLGYQTYRTNSIRCHHVGNITISKIPDRKKYTTANREYLGKWREKNGIK